MTRVLTVGAALVAVVVGATVTLAYALAERQLGRTHEVPAEATLIISADSASLERGRHLVTSVATCTLCHGEDLGGTLYADEGLVGVIAGPNLTRGAGGVGAVRSDADLERAIRHGVRPDGTSLIVMPSEVYVHLTNQDVAAMIAYLRQVPPVDRELPATRFGSLGRMLLAAGKLPLLVAGKTPQLAHPASATPEVSVAYGRYLADIAGCHGCHGHGLSGGRVAGPPDLPLASNLTPAGLGSWTLADFMRVLREGRRPTGVLVDEFMPWRQLGGMTDEEMEALWIYLQSVPPRQFGTK